MKRECSTCDFFEYVEDEQLKYVVDGPIIGVGYCHCYPPTSRPPGQHSVLPEVTAIDFCSCWEGNQAKRARKKLRKLEKALVDLQTPDPD